MKHLHGYLTVFTFVVTMPSVGTHSPAINQSSSDQRWTFQYDAHSSPQYNKALSLLSRYSTILFPSKDDGSYQVLDVGCGTGKITYRIADIFGITQVIGIDRSDEAIATAQSNNVSAAVEFFVYDAHSLPVEYGSKFKVVTCFAALHWMDNKHKAIENMARALQPGGYLFIYCASIDYSQSALPNAIKKALTTPEYQYLLPDYQQQMETLGVDFATLESLMPSSMQIIEKKLDPRTISFPNKQKYIEWVNAWAGGIKVLASLTASEQKNIVEKAVEYYLEENPLNPDESVEYHGVPGIILLARKNFS